MKKKLILIAIAIVVASVAFGILTRFSYKDISAQLLNADKDDSYISYIRDETDMNLIPTDLTDLLQNCDLAVRVIATEDSEPQELCTLTEVTVLDVYRGDESLIDSRLSVYEPAGFHNGLNSVRYVTYSGYTLMKTGNEYILFLSEVVYPDDPFRKEQTENTYYPCSCQFGKYCLSETESVKIIEANDLMIDLGETYRYRDIKDSAFFTNSTDDAALYENIFEDIMTELYE